MSTEIKVPVLPESVSDATIATWHKKVGDAVKRDENIVDLETDKVVLEVPSPVDGVIKEIKFAEGATVLSGSASSGGPQVAVNDSGVAFAAWCGANNRMWASRRVAPGAWEAASSSATDCCAGPALDTPGAGISVGVAASGMAIVVGSTANRVCARRYDPASGWLGTSILGTPGGDAVGAQVAVNPSGQALVAWNNFTTGGALIKVRAYDPATGWGSVLTGPAAGNGRLGLGIGSAGNGAVVYRASGGLIKAVPFSISSGALEDPIEVASSAETLYYLRVGYDPSESSQGISVWQRAGVGGENIWGSRLGL